MQRYNLHLTEINDNEGGWITGAHMCPEPDGQWVKYDDIVSKLNELDERIRDISLYPEDEKPWYEG